jgi:hypothetical protein
MIIAFLQRPGNRPLLFACIKTVISPRENGAFIMKYTQALLNKLEKILEESEYVVRYERGNFQSGYCILEERKVVVLNKFLQVEGRINTLIDLVPRLNIQADQLTPETYKTYRSIFEQQETGTENQP